MAKTMWISKYALSSGEVDEVEARISQSAEYMWVGTNGFYKIGRDIHETEEGAKAAAEDMRVKKIASLKKQIAKLEKMQF